MNQKNRVVQVYGLWLIDMICISVSYWIATNLRFAGNNDWGSKTLHYAVLIVFLLFCTVYGFFNEWNRDFLRRGAFRELMAPAGALDELNEHLIDAASAVSGCGPAYAYLFIEALADGGVKNGLPRAKAQRYAAQMLLGSAEMVLRTGRHPGQLKDEVCSPGGSTIAGVAALERSGFRSACIEAVDAAVEKTRQLG